ncbi:type II secretion system protein GspK [Planctomycetota bacterium]
MKRLILQKSSNHRCSGVVLLVTLVLLIVLSILGYTISTNVSSERHRRQYIINYQLARYGCDSALKYAFATIEDVNAILLDRPNEPDFSDVFWLSEEEYEEFLLQWFDANEIDVNEPDKKYRGTKKRRGKKDIYDDNDLYDDDLYDDDYYDEYDEYEDSNDSNSLWTRNLGIDKFRDRDSSGVKIRGPYGSRWPLVIEPVEFEIGTARVRIEIEDENAKYPICWMMMDDPEIAREIEAGFETFCEWMDVNDYQVDLLKEQLAEIGEIKPFEVEFKPKKKKVERTDSRSANRRRRRKRKAPAAKKSIVVISVAEQIARQSEDFSKLLHSSMIDRHSLAEPTVLSDRRKESALKYIAMWGSAKVNVNTAPRQVLEAVFNFGGDYKEIADQIIQQRRIKPFKDVDELQSELLRYSDSIRKCERFITTRSSFFTIKVTAVSGTAKASAVIAVTLDKTKKAGQRIRRIAVISG